MKLPSLLVGVVALAALAGCGESIPSLPQQKVYPVTGKVTFRGKPTEGIRVTFVATVPIDERYFNSEPFTAADGTFRCTTYKEGDGLPAGVYNVWLTWPEQPNEDQRSMEFDRLGSRYNNPNAPAYRITVKEGDNPPLSFDLR